MALADKTDIAVERVFSEAVDYNPLDENLYCLPARTLAQSFEWNYERVNSVYVPQMHRRRYLTLDGVTTRFDRTFTLVQATVNQPIDAATFTVAQLGLDEGERFVDHLANTLSIQHGGVLVAPDDGRGSPMGRLLKIVAWSSPCVLLVLAILVRRQRRQATLA